jgi:Cu(I)/Ag(I) efflux system membrane protein CusA/SilA
MTVSTVVAGLLPIMWSHRVGAEVMRPLAAPVLGGMVTSLLHVLIVTPVIFYLIRARELPTSGETPIPGLTSPSVAGASGFHRRGWMLGVAGAVVLMGVAWWLVASGTPRDDRGANWPVLRTEVIDGVRVTVRVEGGTLSRSDSQMRIEFRDATTDALRAVERVSVSATMSMPGMAMTAGGGVNAEGNAGVFVATTSFGMSGAWRLTVSWQGRSGTQSISFDGDVQ